MAAKTSREPEYRLTELRADNFKRLRAVRILPDGAVVQITGKNGMGKSSVLDAFAAAVGGKALCPKEPIRKGQDKAELFVDLNAMRVTRKFWRTDGDEVGSSLLVEYKDGSRPKSPQAVLDELRGTDLAVDPVEFTRMASKDQADVLKALVPGFDFAAGAKKRKELYEQRTVIGRERDRAKAAGDGIEVPANAPKKSVDVSALLEEMDALKERNQTLARRRERREAASDTLSKKRDEIDLLRARLAEMEREADALENQIKHADPLPEPESTAELSDKIRDAAALNLAHDAWKRRETAYENHRAAVDEYDTLTLAIEDLDAAKGRAIEQARLPVKGLAFDDEGVRLNGVPFEQASMAEQLRASVGLAMALKPRLRVILVRDGSLLDEDSLAMLQVMAEENDFVVLLERVAAGERVGIVIEDGEVAR